MIRKFQVAEGREVSLPHGLQTAPGANTMRAKPGEILEIEAERCQAFTRFLNGRIAAGDLTEVNEPPSDAPRAIDRERPKTVEKPFEIPTKGDR